MSFDPLGIWHEPMHQPDDPGPTLSDRVARGAPPPDDRGPDKAYGPLRAAAWAVLAMLTMFGIVVYFTIATFLAGAP